MYAEKGGWVGLLKMLIFPRVPGTKRVGVSGRQTIVAGTWYPNCGYFFPKAQNLVHILHILHIHIKPVF